VRRVLRTSTRAHYASSAEKSGRAAIWSLPCIGEKIIVGMADSRTHVNAAAFVAGDWGTTNLRLFLCDADGNQIDSLVGPGARQADGNYAKVYDSLTSSWAQDYGPLQAILCGMVGSSIGWKQSQYVPCPATAEQIAKQCVELRDGQVRIVPGLSCRNRFGAPDLMRGEETQVLGALELTPELREGRHLLCGPGTHTKWIVIEDGFIREVLTAPTGELFALIRDHSVLVESRSHARDMSAQVAFKRGVAEVARYPRAQLLHRIFECRSRPLTKDLYAEESASYLSGVLIASDVRGALEVFTDVDTKVVYIIGSNELSDAYAHALASAGRDMQGINGLSAARAGLVHLRELLEQE
jgi:2-dehydro-3-deoxygalactonokinase